MNEITLNNGVTIPQVGFGTAAIGSWQQDDDYVKNIILDAIEAGFRHIDTASLYGNERSVGKAIRESGIPREEFFITSKVWDNQQGFDQTLLAFKASLQRLGTDYLDLYLIHWPVPAKTRETWQALEHLHEQKRIHALGLSNFRQSDIAQLLSFASYLPSYNQLELHPYLTQTDLVEYCDSLNIVVSCWSPLGSGSWSGVAMEEKPVADPVILSIAENHGVSPAQVILKWDLQQNRIVIPKSETRKNIISNLSLDGFDLSESEIAQINGLNKDLRFGADPDTAYDNNMQMAVPD